MAKKNSNSSSTAGSSAAQSERAGSEDEKLDAEINEFHDLIRDDNDLFYKRAGVFISIDVLFVSLIGAFRLFPEPGLQSRDGLAAVFLIAMMLLLINVFWAFTSLRHVWKIKMLNDCLRAVRQPVGEGMARRKLALPRGHPPFGAHVLIGVGIPLSLGPLLVRLAIPIDIPSMHWVIPGVALWLALMLWACWGLDLPWDLPRARFQSDEIWPGVPLDQWRLLSKDNRNIACKKRRMASVIGLLFLFAIFVASCELPAASHRLTHIEALENATTRIHRFVRRQAATPQNPEASVRETALETDMAWRAIESDLRILLRVLPPQFETLRVQIELVLSSQSPVQSVRHILKDLKLALKTAGTSVESGKNEKAGEEAEDLNEEGENSSRESEGA